jgi:hypothetical protein
MSLYHPVFTTQINAQLEITQMHSRTFLMALAVAPGAFARIDWTKGDGRTRLLGSSFGMGYENATYDYVVELAGHCGRPQIADTELGRRWGDCRSRNRISFGGRRERDGGCHRGRRFL